MPTVSISDGRRLLKGRVKYTYASQGNASRRTIVGKISSVALMYEEVSSSASRLPTGFPNAISEITSRVKNCDFGAKPTGLYTVPVERYFDSRSVTNLAKFESMECSR